MIKKEILAIVIFASVFFLGSVFAISSDIKESYLPKETMIIKLSGSILSPITSSQIEFKRANVNVPLEYDIKKIGDNYYIWAIAPQSANNYSLNINNIESMVAGVSAITNYSKDFIIEGNLTDYYLKPGFIITGKPFKLDVVSNLDDVIRVPTNFPYSGDISLVPGENVIDFDIPNIKESEFITIKIGKYYLPAYLMINSSNMGDYNNETNISYIYRPNFIFSPGGIEGIIMTGKPYPIYMVNLINLGDKNITNVYLDYNRNLFVMSPDQKINLEPNMSFSYNLTLRSRVNESLNEIIYARYGNYSAAVSLNINFTINSSEISVIYSNVSKSINYSTRKCIEVGNGNCETNEICNGTLVQTLDGPCCIGLCRSNSNNENENSSWIGWIFGLIVVIILAFVGYKYYQTKGIGAGGMFKKKVSEAEKKTQV